MSLTENTKIRHAYTKSDQSDIHESVLDMVVDTAPMATPLLAMAIRGTNPNPTKFEWGLDYSGPYPSSISGLVRGEGDDADPALSGKRTRLFNYTHIWGRSWSVSHTAEVVDMIGISSEFDYQAAKNARLTARDFNYLLMNSEARAEAGTPNAAGNERRMGGLRDLIQNIGDDTGGPVDFVSSHGTLPDGTTTTITNSDWEGYTETTDAALTTAHLNAALKRTWEVGGLGSGVIQILTGGDLKTSISELYGGTIQSGDVTKQLHRRDMGTGASTEIVLPVDVIVTDYAEMHCHMDQSVGTGEVIGFDPEYFNLNVLRDFEVIELAKTGPSQHGMIEAEMTCSLLAPNTAFWLANKD